jgi:hypothetical protein
MVVRALRMTVLKSAGNFTCDERRDLNAEKIQPVKCFVPTTCGICCVRQFSNAGAAGWVRKFPLWSIGASGSPSRHVRYVAVTPGVVKIVHSPAEPGAKAK